MFNWIKNITRTTLSLEELWSVTIVKVKNTFNKLKDYFMVSRILFHYIVGKVFYFFTQYILPIFSPILSFINHFVTHKKRKSINKLDTLHFLNYGSLCDGRNGIDMKGISFPFRKNIGCMAYSDNGTAISLDKKVMLNITHVGTTQQFITFEALKAFVGLPKEVTVLSISILYGGMNIVEIKISAENHFYLK